MERRPWTPALSFKCTFTCPSKRVVEEDWSHTEEVEAMALEHLRPVMQAQVTESCQPPATGGVKKPMHPVASQSGGMVLDTAEFGLVGSTTLEEIDFSCLQSGKLW